MYRFYAVWIHEGKRNNRSDFYYSVITRKVFWREKRSLLHFIKRPLTGFQEKCYGGL